MTEATAIAMQAEIVGMRNVDTHKSAVLTLHIPQELARKFVDQFGWPTKVDPIPVALAKLNMADASTREDEDSGEIPVSTSAPKPKREMTLPQIVGAECQKIKFHEFMAQNYPVKWMDAISRHADKDNSEISAILVRDYCGVQSRSEILPGTPAQKKWAKLYYEYEDWLRGQS